MPTPSKRPNDLQTQHQEDMRQQEERRERQSRASRERNAKPLTTDKPVMRFRLLAGAHIGADLREEPQVRYNNATGEPILNPRTKEPIVRHPSKQYVAGDVVEADHDLVEKCGANKFMLLGDARESGDRRTIMRQEEFHRNDPAAAVMERDPAKAPHGQVSTGYQEAMPTLQEGQEQTGVQSGGLSEKGRELMRQAHDENSPAPDPQVNRTTAEEGQPSQNVPSHGGPGGEAQAEEPQQERKKVTLPGNVNTMSVRELRDFSAKNEIDLKGATTRDDILRHVRQAARG
jgi:hypothetical protein